LQVRSGIEEQRTPTRAAGTDARSTRQVVELLAGTRHQRVSRVVPGRESGELEPWGWRGWHVLEAVDGEIDLF
jgi:hypothetical protein